MFFAVSALGAILLTAPSASASGGNPVCIPESLRLLGTDGTSICLAIPTPSIAPPFIAFTEQNGSQDTWCLYTQPKYTGAVVRIPGFSRANVFATFASGRPC
ncbi:hypothetical protein AB0F15_31780 [Amycolatopsis sp. NPDC026612]|uniref:hypothetical protein n=1 Tax=Amycolatopsis sp. NPDC026612 TaxID=3155466 RepID=UPI0033C13CC9